MTSLKISLPSSSDWECCICFKLDCAVGCSFLRLEPDDVVLVWNCAGEFTEGGGERKFRGGAEAAIAE